MHSTTVTTVIYLGFRGFELAMNKLFLIRLRSFQGVKLSLQENIFIKCWFTIIIVRGRGFKLMLPCQRTFEPAKTPTSRGKPKHQELLRLCLLYPLIIMSPSSTMCPTDGHGSPLKRLFIRNRQTPLHQCWTRTPRKLGQCWSKHCSSLHLKRLPTKCFFKPCLKDSISKFDYSPPRGAQWTLDTSHVSPRVAKPAWICKLAKVIDIKYSEIYATLNMYNTVHATTGNRILESQLRSVAPPTRLLWLSKIM